MLGKKCPTCKSQLLSTSAYAKRKHQTVGLFCPSCLRFINYTENFNKFRDEVIEENKEKAKSKPKFLKKQRIACPYCYNNKKNPKVNRSKWTIRKIPKKKDETQHWKCTCQLCGNVWTQNTGNEYHYFPESPKDYEKLDF